MFQNGLPKGEKDPTRIPTSLAADSQNRDQPAVMVFLVHSVTGETAVYSTVRTAFFSENQSPEDFYPAEAIV